MSKVQYTICDVCGKQINDIQMPNHLYMEGERGCTGLPNSKLDMDVCPECYEKIKDFIQAIQRQNDLQTDKDKLMRPVDEGFSSHDACNYYHCPTCGYSWSSWNEDKIKNNDNRCPKCGQRLILDK